jgi:hypothetical protein
MKNEDGGWFDVRLGCLAVLLLLLFATIPSDISDRAVPNMQQSQPTATISKEFPNGCQQGMFRHVSQLPYKHWFPFEGAREPLPLRRGVDVLPYYATADIHTYNSQLKHAIIIMHGNLRNGNLYYCTTVNVLLNQSAALNQSGQSVDDYIVIAPEARICH